MVPTGTKNKKIIEYTSIRIREKWSQILGLNSLFPQSKHGLSPILVQRNKCSKEA